MRLGIVSSTISKRLSWKPIFAVVTTLFCVEVLPIPVSADTSPVKIGVISGLTGGAAKWNRFQNMGMQLAQEELKKNGFHTELIFEDSKTNPAQAISAFEKLSSQDKVDSFISDDFGFVVAPLIPKVNRQKKLFVTLALPHDHYCKESQGSFFSISSQFARTKSAFAKFYDLHPEVKKVAFIAFDDPEWGNTYLRIWKEIAAERGIEVVETYLNADMVPDLKNFWTRLMPKAPDAIFVAHESEAFFKGRSQFRYSGFIVAANNLFEMLADSSGPRPELEGVYVVDPEISSAFRERFVKRFGQEPILEAYSGYESMMTTARAFAANPANPSLGMKSVRYTGVAGPIDFTNETCVGNESNWALYQFQNAALVKQ